MSDSRTVLHRPRLGKVRYLELKHCTPVPIHCARYGHLLIVRNNTEMRRPKEGRISRTWRVSVCMPLNRNIIAGLGFQLHRLPLFQIPVHTSSISSRCISLSSHLFSSPCSRNPIHLSSAWTKHSLEIAVPTRLYAASSKL